MGMNGFKRMADNWLRVRWGRAIVLGITIALLITIPAGLAQEKNPTPAQEKGSPIPGVELPDFAVPSRTPEIRDVATGAVRLDGRRLFTIAVPTPTQSDNQNNPTHLQERIEGIETTLNRVVRAGIKPKELSVTTRIDESSGLPVITVNDQYLMTVTFLDAQLQGQNPERYAEELVETVRSSLLRAYRERQPQFLTEQGWVAGGLLFAVCLVSWGINRVQHQLKAQLRQLRNEPVPAISTLPESAEAGDAAEVATVQYHLRQRRKFNLKDAQRRFLQLVQIVLWGTTVLLLLGFFPYTRWLQPLILSVPLQVGGIALLTYAAIRVVDVIIDRFTAALEDRSFISPVASQRLSLRVSTFSRVLKSVAAILCFGVGIITILSVIGVNLGPVLAGAGIIGLAISFAAQSLVKDMINGLLILFEDQYAVGDVIAVGSVSGLVEYMNLRITQLRNAEGRLITIPNSSISIVENLSKDWSRVDLAVVIAYDADVERAIAVIRKVGEEIMSDPAWQPQIIEPPEMLGVDQMDNTGVTLRVWIKTQPLQQWNVAREFRRRLKSALDAAGVAIGVPQQALWFRNPIEEDEDPPAPPNQTRIPGQPPAATDDK